LGKIGESEGEAEGTDERKGRVAFELHIEPDISNDTSKVVRFIIQLHFYLNS
jgi:hypothetical protein